MCIRDSIVGGDFLNFDNVALNDYIVGWDGSAYTTLVDTACDGIVYDLIKDAAGNIYAVGVFTDIDGTTCRGIAKYTGGTTWAAVGPPSAISGNAIIHCIALDPTNDGHIYVGGDFTDLDGDGNSDMLGYWDGDSCCLLYTSPSPRDRS